MSKLSYVKCPVCGIQVGTYVSAIDATLRVSAHDDKATDTLCFGAAQLAPLPAPTESQKEFFDRVIGPLPVEEKLVLLRMLQDLAKKS